MSILLNDCVSTRSVITNEFFKADCELETVVKENRAKFLKLLKE